jgi:hypothetical protein
MAAHPIIAFRIVRRLNSITSATLPFEGMRVAVAMPTEWRHVRDQRG